MRELPREYIAALFDTKGHVYIYDYFRADGQRINRSRTRMFVRISFPSKDTLLIIKAFYGGVVYQNKGQWFWDLSQTKAYGFLFDIQKHVRLKQIDVKKGLNFIREVVFDEPATPEVRESVCS